MARQDKQAFIKDLAANHRSRRPLMLPLRRALLWYVIALCVSALLMHSVQVYRPGFLGQLMHHPFFLLEIVSALLIAPLAAYLALANAVPGERVSRKASLGLVLLSLLFVISFSAGFTHLAPETSPVGARHACWMEVVVYGTLCLLLFGIIIGRGWVRFSWKLGFLYGILAGLVPAALMQLACMYNPMHALVFHYLPTVLLIPLGLVLMRAIRRQ